LTNNNKEFILWQKRITNSRKLKKKNKKISGVEDPLLSVERLTILSCMLSVLEYGRPFFGSMPDMLRTTPTLTKLKTIAL